MVRLSMRLAMGLFACTFFSGCVGMGCFPGTCGSCGPAAFNCDNCDGYGRPLARGPVRRVGAALSCGSGCGEMYVDEWRNYPPNPCDPCESIGGCRPILGGLRNLFGYRTHECETCYGDGGLLKSLGPGCMQGGGCAAGCAEPACGVDAYYPTGGGGCSSCGVSNRLSPRATIVGSNSIANGSARTANAANGVRPALRSTQAAAAAGQTR